MARAIGVLGFEPANALQLDDHDAAQLPLTTQAQMVLPGDETSVLTELALLGGSPHGSRPKVLVHVTKDGQVSTLARPGAQAWLVKFQAAGKFKEVCVLEDVYPQLARDCGIDMPRTRHFDLGPQLAAFATCRFDVEDGPHADPHAGRAPACQLCAALRVDYTTFLRAARLLTRDEHEVKKAFSREVFNVVFNNRHDHPKNFSFRLHRDRYWKLPPGYDLTFNEGPRGKHQMDVCGEARTIQRQDLLQLATQASLDRRWASGEIDWALDISSSFRGRAQAVGLSPALTDTVVKQLRINSAHLHP